jgi:hypothetical protein
MFKKIICTFLVLIFIFFSLPVRYSFAQNTGPWYSQSWQQWYTKVYDTNNPNEIFGERYTAAQVSWVMYGLGSFLLNQVVGALGGSTNMVICIMNGDIGSCLKQIGALSYGPSNIQKESTSQGVLATIFSPQRSLSGVNYVRSKLTNFHIIKQAEAQGFGFSALNPVQDAWKTFRNFMYGIFIIIIIIMAFMIMFRVKLSPQTVITVQSAIPKIIISLILITFSYAIAGLMIDLLYVVIGIFAWLVNQNNLFWILRGLDWGQTFKMLTDGPGGLGIFGMLIVYIVSFVIGLVAAIFGSGGIVTGVTAALGLIIGTVSIILFGPIVVLTGFLLLIGLILSILWFGVKVFLMMIKTFVTIILLVIFAPFYIGIGTIFPGMGFGKWLKSLTSNLLVYIVVDGLILLSFMFLGASFDSVFEFIAKFFGSTYQPVFPGGPGTSFWYPPMTLGTQSSSFDPLPLIWLFSSLVIMSIIPKAADMVKSLVEGRPMTFGSGVGEMTPFVMPVGRLGIQRYQEQIEAGRYSAAHPGTTPYFESRSTQLLRYLNLYKK